MSLEIVHIISYAYEVHHPHAGLMFEGSKAECEDFVCEYEDDYWADKDDEESELD